MAIANPVYDEGCNLIGYHVERTLAIDLSKVKRVINSYMNGMRENYNPEAGLFKFKFEDCTVFQFVGSLPYGIELNVTKI